MMKQLLTRLILIATIFGGAAHGEAVTLDRIVAIVNNEAISQSELDNEMQTVKLQLRQQTTLPDDAVLQAQVLDRLILKHLQQQLAVRNNIIVDDETLNRALNSIAQQNKLSLAQLRATLERDGLSFNSYRESIRDEILQSRLRQRYIDNRISITEAEVAQQLNQQQDNNTNMEYRLSHILISLPEGASPEQINEAKNKARSIIDRLKAGEDFAQLAIAISAGQTALSGGDLGWRKSGELPTLFANVIPTLTLGEVSEPIRSPSGFHIIKIAEQRGGQRHIINQTLARHILIRTNELITDDKARQRLLELKQRIENGDDFAELARANSDDTGSAAKGGELGWSSPGQMVPVFETAMDALQIGVISEPFQSKFGWHIVQVLDRRQHDDTEQFRRNSVRQQLFERKVAEEQELWLRRLKDEAYIEIRI